MKAKRLTPNLKRQVREFECWRGIQAVYAHPESDASGFVRRSKQLSIYIYIYIHIYIYLSLSLSLAPSEAASEDVKAAVPELFSSTSLGGQEFSTSPCFASP